jgi:PAS domain S-box-containing protein
VSDRCIYASQQLSRILGLSTVEEYVEAASSHEADLDWVHPEDRGRYDRVVGEAFDKGVPFDIEYRIVRRDGEIRHVHGRGEPLPDTTGAKTRAIGSLLDVTARKAAEDALRESEGRLRAIIDNAPVHISMKDLEGRHVVIGPNSEAILGYPSEKVLGSTSHEIFSDEEADFFTSHDRAVRESGRTIAMENEITLPDGVHIINTVRFPIRDAAGNLSAIGAITADITEQKEAEKALRESEGRLRAVIDNAPVHISMKDLDGRHVVIGPNSEAILGYPSEKILGSTSHEIFTEEEAEFFTSHDREVRESGRTITMENEITLPDGVHTINTVRFPIRDAAGNLSTIGAITADITEQKEAERALRESDEQFRAVFENARVSIYVKDLEGRYLLVNPAFEIWTGISFEEARGKTAEDLFPYRVLEAAGGTGALALLEGTTGIDLLLTDLVLADGMTGPDVARAGVAIRPGLAVMFMSGQAEGAIRQLAPIGEDAELLRKPFRKVDLARRLRDVLDADSP